MKSNIKTYSNLRIITEINELSSDNMICVPETPKGKKAYFLHFSANITNLYPSIFVSKFRKNIISNKY